MAEDQPTARWAEHTEPRYPDVPIARYADAGAAARLRGGLMALTLLRWNSEVVVSAPNGQPQEARHSILR